MQRSLRFSIQKSSVISVLALAGATLTLAACDSNKVDIGQQKIEVPSTPGPDYDGAQMAARAQTETSSPNWWEVSQGLNNEERRALWFTPQGSKMLPLSWAKALLTHDTVVTDPNGDYDDHRFFGDTNMRRLGYIPASKDMLWNQHGLPIGFAHLSQASAWDKDYAMDEDFESVQDITEWMGPTCAACHTNMIEMGQKRVPVLIDGAGTLADFERMNDDMVEALVDLTDTSSAKWTKFHQDVLGKTATPETINKLQQSLAAYTMRLVMRNEINRGVYDPAYSNPDDPRRYGHGRLDAVGALFNKAAATLAKESNANAKPSDAPVSYPFLWGTPQSDVVQWNGFAPNNAKGLGALVRNVGEVIGVYGEVHIKDNSNGAYTTADDGGDPTGADNFIGYKSSVNVGNLGHLEDWVSKLRSPQWPENLLGGLDQAKAEQGRRIYIDTCAACHKLIDRADQGKSYAATLVSQSYVKTDATFVDNFNQSYSPINGGWWQAGILENSLGINPATGKLDRLQAWNDGRAAFLVNVAIGVIADRPLSAFQSAGRSFDNTFKSTSPTTGRQYKARPLTGIWATAPYLHNGSVPNLKSMLLPQEDRPKSFMVGSRLFDPVNVGFVSDGPDAEGFTFDTSLRGNSNQGHDFARHLTEVQRDQLLEFLKTM